MVNSLEDYHTCIVCARPVHDYGPGADAVCEDGAWMHKGCAEPEVPSILEKQLSKSLEPVIWDGERTVLGSLTTHERMSLERNADGVLEGGMPF